MKQLLWMMLLLSFPLSATETVLLSDQDKIYRQGEAEWGIAIGGRVATTVFSPDEESQVKDFVPKMYYEGEMLFLRGEKGGLRFFQEPKYSFSVLGNYRYFDIPAQYQNKLHGTSIDGGLQFEYLYQANIPLQLELMSDSSGNAYANANMSYKIHYRDLDIDFNSTLRYKSSDFNNLYYGLNQENIGSDFDLKVGTELRYHLFSNLYLLGEINLTVLGDDTYQSALIDSRTQAEYYLGFGFFKNKKAPTQLTLPENHYLRWAFAWGTPSNIGDIIHFKTEKDPYNNRLTSLFYGIPLTESLFGAPIELFLTPGLVYHLASDVQDNGSEYVLAIKAYYTFTWPVRWRFGFAEGLSYTSNINWLEYDEIINKKGYDNASKFLNYLDFSLDVNLADLTTLKSLDKLWLGYSIHHRSAIFESSSLFGRIKGGSNYNSVYLQWHF